MSIDRLLINLNVLTNKALNMPFLKKLTDSGVYNAASRSEKRNIILTNYIALITAATPLIQLFIRLLFYNIGPALIFRLLAGAIVFLIPIGLNRLGHTLISRLVLCWLPYLYLFALIKLEGGSAAAEPYIAFRFFYLAVSCFPFIVFNLNTPKLFIAGLLAPTISLLFFDPILNLLGVGFLGTDNTDAGYSFNTVRSFVSFIVIASCFYFLKWLHDTSEAENEQLVEELAEKNAFIQQQAKDEVHQLNQKLLVNVEQLKEREFILMQSQRIAKIGSWESIHSKELFWSEEMYNIFGVDKNINMKEEYLAELFKSPESTELNALNKNLASSGQSYDHIMHLKTPLGYKKWIRIYAFPIYEEQKIIGSRGICHDITYYKEAEEKMAVSEKRYRSLFEQASDAIMVTDFNGNFTEVNASLCKMFGYTREELLQLDVSKLIDSENLKTKPIAFSALEIGEHIFSQRPMVRKDGTIVEVESNVKKSGDGRIMAIVRDVTELRKAQKQVQISEALFRGAFEDSAIGMAVVSLDGRWIKVNKELSNITGYSESELLSKTFYEITHPDDLPRDNENMQNAQAGRSGAFKVEKRYIHKNGNTIWVNINVSVIKDAEGIPLYLVSQIENISDQKKAEFEKERARYQLNERIKELTTLYRTSQILQIEETSVAEALQQIVTILPPGWQYPEICEARITLNDLEYKTPNYKSSPYSQRAEFKTAHGVTGEIEVLYREERPIEIEGPFLAEERNLINMLAEMIRVYLIRKHDVEALRESDANLNATINNTEILIWSVDRNFNIITFNKPFFDYVKNTYGKEIKTGQRIFSENDQSEHLILRSKWEQIYLRSLAGEIISLEENRHDTDFVYSLSPIVENNNIIGVSVFADNVTERKIKERELTEANKKIGELKLMALRSVMNPHFIFNVLNSIQFFIAKNDRLNAINYLSTFSKLIRSILTHSVNNKIKLADEIELLKNYVHLEMTRFENKFHFVLNIDKEIEADNIEIPSLLIQPYVENAILHGLYNKTDHGTLTINILNKEDAVIFEIQDDGIGREAATKIRQQNFSGHKSMGIKLTEERLKLINEHHNVSFEVKDLVNEQGPCGTKVIILVTA
jgi:PAS domain S-box-containing protein